GEPVSKIGPGLGSLCAKVDNRRFRLVGMLAVFAIGLLLFANTFNSPFVNWDDPALIENNLAIRSLAPGDVMRMFVPVSGQTYQPVRVLSYAIDYALWELKPQGYHVLNSLLHAAAGALLFLLSWMLLDRLRPDHGRANRVAALLIALFWVAHPVNVEAVAWAASRKYGLLALFGFAAFCCHLRSSQGERVHWGFASAAAVLSALAVMSSPFGIVFPVLFVLADYCGYRELDPRCGLRKRWRCYLPTAVVFAILAAVLYLALMGEKGPAGSYGDQVSPFHLLLTMLRVVFDYTRNLVFPLFLNAKYGNTVVVSVLNAKVIVTVLAIIGTAAGVIWRWRAGDKLPLFCAGWMAIAWAPVSNLVTISTTMADRYLYIASVGFFVGFVLLLDAASQRISAKAVLGGAAVLLLACGALTVQRNAIWGDNLLLWEDSVRKDPNSPMARFNYGNALQEAERYDEALENYLASRTLFPTHVSLHNNLGALYARTKRFDEAIASLQRALELAPGNVSALQQLGSTFADAKRPKDAAAAFSQWADITGDPSGYKEAGLALGHGGLHLEAIAQFQKLLAANPKSDAAYKNIGVSYAILGRYAEAASNFEAALKLNPNDAGSAKFLSQVRAKLK
ncbi:MAG: tetratricopeptide (TPR) repeat protein, partial [Rhodothermales bacterium]